MDWARSTKFKHHVTLRTVIDHYGIELRPAGPQPRYRR
jgi:hypothetical protein